MGAFQKAYAKEGLNIKQIIAIRIDLGMSKGKMVSQGSHASIDAFLKAGKAEREEWLSEGMKKVVVKVSSESELEEVFELARAAKLPAAIINDAGLTQLEPGTATAVGIGPAADAKVDKITGKLKLL